MTKWHDDRIKRLYFWRLLVSLAGGFCMARLLMDLSAGADFVPVLWSAIVTSSIFVYMRFTRKIRHSDEMKNRRTRKKVLELERRLLEIEKHVH